jgi:hypothetical protein
MSRARLRALSLALLGAAVLALSACGAPLPRGQGAEVVFTSAEGIAFRQPGGAVHFYRFKNRRQ